MGIGKYGWASLVGFTGFFAYLGQSFTGPDRPKFVLNRDIVEEAAKYQPALVVDHYVKDKN